MKYDDLQRFKEYVGASEIEFKEFNNNYLTRSPASNWLLLKQFQTDDTHEDLFHRYDAATVQLKAVESAFFARLPDTPNHRERSVTPRHRASPARLTSHRPDTPAALGQRTDKPDAALTPPETPLLADVLERIALCR